MVEPTLVEKINGLLEILSANFPALTDSSKQEVLDDWLYDACREFGMAMTLNKFQTNDPLLQNLVTQKVIHVQLTEFGTAMIVIDEEVLDYYRI